MKKAGIIVGVLILLLAFGIQWAVKRADNEGVDGGKVASAPSPAVTADEGSSVPVDQPVVTTPPVAPVVPVEPLVSGSSDGVAALKEGDVTADGTLSKRVYTEYDESEVKGALGDPSVVKKELMTVSNKKVVLLDGDAVQGSKTSKQLVYAIEVLGSGTVGTLSIYVNGLAYDGVEVGQKLQVEYAVYRNANGVSLPVVITVEKQE